MIRLEIFTSRDIERLINWIKSDDLLFQWTGTAFEFPLDKKRFLKHVKESEAYESNKLIFKVVNNGNSKAIGHGEICNIDLINKSARLARILIGVDEYKGKGYCTELIKELLKYSFNELQLNRVELVVFEFNKPAIVCYEKAGFKTEGILREYRFHNKRFYDLRLMSVLKKEWMVE